MSNFIFTFINWILALLGFIPQEDIISFERTQNHKSSTIRGKARRLERRRIKTAQRITRRNAA